MTDLGTLGGPISWALDINDRGDIVGWSRRSSPGDHAVLWRAGQLIDLQNASDVPPDCVLNKATGINNRGDILADIRCSGRAKVAILTSAK
jgi:probable HAF family extracellular repeat protein